MAHDYITTGNTGISLASGAASNGATLPLDLAGNVPRLIRISATAPACIRIGVGAQTAVITDLQVQPGDSAVISTNGRTHIAVLQVAAAGIVQISPLENLS